jgi:hypothetical protein
VDWQVRQIPDLIRVHHLTRQEHALSIGTGPGIDQRSRQIHGFAGTQSFGRELPSLGVVGVLEKDPAVANYLAHLRAGRQEEALWIGPIRNQDERTGAGIRRAVGREKVLKVLNCLK